MAQKADPTYETPFARLTITAKNPDLRAWMVASISAGKAQGKAPLGEVTVTGGSLQQWKDYGEVVLPTVLSLEKMARGTDEIVNLTVVIRKGQIQVLNNGKPVPQLDMRVNSPVKTGLTDFADALLPLLGINGSVAKAMLVNAKKAITTTDKPRFTYKADPQTANVTGTAVYPGIVKVEVVPLTLVEAAEGDKGPKKYNRGDVVVTANAEKPGTVRVEFVCNWLQLYDVVMYDADGKEMTHKRIKPDPEWDAKNAKPAKPVDGANTSAEPQITLESTPMKWKKSTVTAACKGASEWFVFEAAAKVEAKNILEQGKGDSAEFELKGLEDGAEFKIVFKVGDEPYTKKFAISK